MDKINKTARYLIKYKRYSVSILFFVILGTAFEGFSAGMLIPILQQIISHDINVFAKIPVLYKLHLLSNFKGTKEILFVLLAFTFSLILLKNILIFTGKKLIWKLRSLLYKDLQNELFDKLIAGGINFFDAAKSGHIMHSFNRETELISTYMFNILTLATILIQISVYLLVLAFISWRLGILCIFLIVLIFPVVHFIRKRKEVLSILSNKAQAEVSFILTEILSGIRTIKLFTAENIMRGYFRKELDGFTHKDYKANVYQELLTPVSEVMIAGAISAIFIIGISLKGKVDMPLPQIIAFMWILFRLLNQLNNFNHFRTEMAGCVGAFDSYERLLRRIENSIPANNYLKLGQFSDKIEFKKVTFSYGEGKEIFKDLSFDIPKGKITAIAGSSGAGKSTIANLIARLYDVTRGEIMVDGINLKLIDLHSWRSKISFVLQDTFIFNVSARDNIAFGLPEISEEKIIIAAKTANIHDFITTLPKGYDTLLGERGVRLSGGQRQRISIARAVIREPEILILDEATSALDTESERLVQGAIDTICKNHTVIVIAHRLSTIENADKLIVIENGQKVEEGTHKELLELSGRYCQLYLLQEKPGE